MLGDVVVKDRSNANPYFEIYKYCSTLFLHVKCQDAENPIRKRKGPEAKEINPHPGKVRKIIQRGRAPQFLLYFIVY